MPIKRIFIKSRISKELGSSHKNKSSFPIVFFIFLILLTALLISAAQRLGKMIIKLSEWVITDTITVQINDAVYEEIEKYKTEYTDIITFEKDSEGKITALKTNIAYVNRLQTKIINKIYEVIPYAETEIIEVPVANLIGSKLFAGNKPYIPVKVISVTNVNPSFENDFSDAGINQTRHRIILNIDVELSVLVPGYSGLAYVQTAVPIAETVVVGDVPETYIDFN